MKHVKGEIMNSKLNLQEFVPLWGRVWVKQRSFLNRVLKIVIELGEAEVNRVLCPD